MLQALGDRTRREVELIERSVQLQGGTAERRDPHHLIPTSRDWWQVSSTNPLEHVNKELKRRTDVVGTFPNPVALLRSAGRVLIEQYDEWDRAHRRYCREYSMKLLLAELEEEASPELTAA